MTDPGGEGSHGRRLAHEAMACTWELRLWKEAPGYAEQVAQAVFDEIDRLEQELSRFILTSDIGRINAVPVGTPLRIGPDAFECLEIAERLRVATGGAFDVAVGGAVDRSLGRADAAAADAGTAATERSFVIDRAARTVTRRRNVRLDLGGVGKGFALDRGVAVLRDWGVQRAMLHSGQSTVFALTDAGEGWRVALRAPGGEHGAVALRNRALAGSGRDGHGAHIVDPRDGAAVVGPAAAWALAETAAEADGWSTALLVLGRAGLERLPPGGGPAGGVLVDGECTFSNGWPAADG